MSYWYTATAGRRSLPLALSAAAVKAWRATCFAAAACRKRPAACAVAAVPRPHRPPIPSES